MDVVDTANETAELFLQLALRNRKPEKPATTLCCYCEEKPAAILQNGARSRFCLECAGFATP